MQADLMGKGRTYDVRLACCPATFEYGGTRLKYDAGDAGDGDD